MPDENSQLAVQDSMVPSTMTQALDFARQMADARLLPAHLQKSPADCLRVVLQASRWQMDPFAVADKTSIIGGKMMYEGQLVMAVVNARGKLAKRLEYNFAGAGKDRVLTVTGTLRGEEEAREITLDFATANRINKNRQIEVNPDQQMTYIGARLWARRHMPELMLGVYTPDEIDPDEMTNVTPGAESNRDPLPEKSNAPAAGDASKTATPEKKFGRKAKDNTAIDVETTKTDAKTPDKPKPADTRTTLNADEKATFICNVTSVLADDVKYKGSQHPSVIAELAGGFAGKVRHLDAAPLKDGKRQVPPEWQMEKPVEVVLFGVGRPSKPDPKAPDDRLKDIPQDAIVFVESIRIADAAKNDGEDLGS